MNKKDPAPYFKKFNTNIKNIHVFITYFSHQKLVRDFGTGINSNIIQGTPIILPDSVIFKGCNNFLSTKICDSEAITIFSIVKRPTKILDYDALIVSNNSTTDVGVSLIWSNTGNLSFAAARNNNQGKQTSAQATLQSITLNDEWIFVMGESSNDIPNTLTNLKTGEIVKSNNINSRVISNKFFNIGSGYSQKFEGESQHLLTIIINRLLSEEEKISLIYSIKKITQKLNIII